MAILCEMRSLLFLACAVLFVGLLAAGCTTKAPVPTPVPSIRSLVPAMPVTIATIAPLTDPVLSGPWILKRGMKNNGTVPIISDVQLSITFNSDGTFSGFGGCSNYQGNYILTGKTTEFGKTIKMGPIAKTAMYCAQTTDAETSYLQVLQATITYSITNNEYMILRTAAGDQLSYRSVNL